MHGLALICAILVTEYVKCISCDEGFLIKGKIKVAGMNGSYPVVIILISCHCMVTVESSIASPKLTVHRLEKGKVLKTCIFLSTNGFPFLLPHCHTVLSLIIVGL